MNRVTPVAFDPNAPNLGQDSALAQRNLNQIEMLFGKAIRDVLMPASGDKEVEHGLGRVPKGYLVTKATGTSPVLVLSASDEATLTFTSGAIALVDLWVW